MKKIVAILVAIVLIFSFAVSTVASGTQSIVLGNAKFTAKNEIQTIAIEANDLDALSVVQVVVSYDSTKVELLDVITEGSMQGQIDGAAGELLNGATVSSPEEGIIIFVWDYHTPVSGSGTLASFRFKALSDNVGLVKLSLTEYDGEESYVCRDDANNIPRKVAIDFLEAASGVTVSGTVTSYLDSSKTVTVALYKEENAEPLYEAEVSGNNAAYSISGVAAGTYTVKVSKDGHATYVEEFEVGAENVTKNFKIYQYGDINGDGSVKANDKTILARHLANWAGYETLDVYDAVADLNGDGSVKANDKTILARHLANWTGYETLPKK